MQKRSERAGLRALAALLATPVVLSLAACGGASSAIDSDRDLVLQGETIATKDTLAKCESQGGELTYYSSAPAETFGGVAEAFKKDTGVTVDQVRATSNELYSKLISEASGGKVGADSVAVNDPTLRQDLYEKKIVADYTIPEEDGLKQLVGDNPQFSFAKPADSASNVIAWNTEVVDDADAPRSYADLLDPKWKGKFGMTPVQTGLSSITVAKSIYDGLGAARAAQFGKQHPKIYPSVVPLSQALVRGEIPVAITDLSIIRGYEKEGNPVAWAAPAEGTPTWSNAQMITADAKHRACALVWAGWVTSLQGAQATFKNTLFLSTRLQADPEHIPADAPDLGKVYSVDTDWLLANRDRFIKEWSAIVPQS